MIVVHDGNVEKALRKLKKKIQEDRLLINLREREQYTKPTTQRKLKANAAKNRWRKYLASQNESISEQKYKQNYTEFSMTIELTNISTTELIEILALIENDIRIYLKNITIKNLNNQKLYLIVSIATLQLITT